jgi:hypothetical protein
MVEVKRRPLQLRAFGATVLLALVALGPQAGRAAAAQPCWKQVLNDWYDGTIDARYPIPCYGQAIEHLPFDTRLYSTAETDIRSAMYDTMRMRGVAAREPMNGEDRRLVSTTARSLEGRSSGVTEQAAATATTADPAKPPLTLLLGAGFAMLLIAFGTVRLLIAKRHALRLRGLPWRRG